MSDNPYKSSVDPEEPQSEDVSSARAAYNLVTDTVIGPNVRKSDNVFQALFTVVSALVFAVVGAVLAALNARWNLPWSGGAVIGAIAGLVIGVFTSGIFLMIYRALRHIQGKHD